VPLFAQPAKLAFDVHQRTATGLGYDWTSLVGVNEESYSMPAKPITHEDVVHLFKELDDHRIAEILATGASPEELEEAAMWAANEGEVMGDLRRPLSGVVAQIYEIVTREERLREEPRTRR
jgi:hypothetical protein